LAQLPGLVGGQELERLKLELLGTTQERMLREFVALLESIATEQPVVLVLEDLHWSDSATLNVIASLARRTEAARLMVLGTYRPVDAALANHPINLLRQDLCSRGRCQELALKPFSKGELRNFLAGRLAVREVPDRAVGWTMRRSQGLPFFVANLVEDWVARDLLNPERDDWGLSGGPDDAAMDIPQRLRALIDQRIDRLDAVEERLLAVASAAGEEWSAALVGAGVEMPTDAVEECCERLASQGRMIAEAGISEWPDGTVAGRYRFLHALYRDVLYQRLPSARLMRLHRRLAERLETAYGEAGFTVAAELAEHFERAGDCPRALRYWSQAVGNATRRYANGEAVACLNRALSLVSELPPDKQGAARLDLLQQRARARSAMDDLAEAIDDFNEILREARERGDAVLEVSTLVEISRLARWTNLQHCVETASEAGERSRGRVDRALCAQAQATSAIARLRCIGWDSKQAAQARDAMAVLRESNETHLISPLVFSYAWMEIVSSNYELASNLAGEGILVTQRLNDAYSLLACRWYQLWSWVYLGRLGATQRCLRDALRLAEASGSAFAELGFRILQARLHEEAGDFAGVLACCNETKAIIEDNRHHYVDRKPLRAAARLSHGLVLEGRAHVKLGHYSTANECLSEARRLIDDEPELADWHLRLPLYLALAEYWLAQGELSRAREFALALHDQAGPPPERTYLALAHALLAEIAMAGRDWDGANRGIERAVEAMHPLPPDRGLWQVYGLVPSATPAEGSETSAPLAAWRVYLTAERLYSGQGRSAEAKHWRERSHAARQRLAASFDPDDPLRATLTTASTGL
jgi:tetratricopeptide (TPR) repeat protein